ncbi:MAG TPA: hypothetical protein VL426_03100, partial [Candidatus Binatia bacterium]|nr:hypothetical protein [Candidatus Binatia bacterium]
ELLIVIGIIGFLAAAVLVAVDPVKRIQDSRDARRYSEANGLLNAILTKQVDDRRLYAGPSDAPVITSATNSQVIVTSTAGIECDLSLTENFPGCKQTLDNSTRTISGQANNSANVVTGTGSSYTTELRVGDTVTDGTSPCLIKSIESNTQFTCVTGQPATAYTNAALKAFSKNCVVNLSDTFTGVGTAAATASTTVTGTNTNFTAQVSVGDTLTSSNTNTCTVTAIASATSLTCSSAVTFTGSYTVTQANPVVPNYIASAPIDPRGAGATSCDTGCTTNAVGITTLGATNTGYYLHRTSGNRIEVGSCNPEQAAAVSVKR